MRMFSHYNHPMIERPNISDASICTALADGYGISPVGLEFLPIGNDSTAWAYRVSADGGSDYFLKLKKGGAYAPGILVPRFLQEQGITAVVAPLTALDGGLCHSAGDFVLILYPFIAGRSGMEIGLSGGQWAEFGRLLKQIHSTSLPADLQTRVPRETFRPYWSAMVHQLNAQMGRRQWTHPLEQELAGFWLQKQADIERITSRAEELGQRLQARAPEFFLCHADIHTANLLIDSRGGLFIVDWDQVIFAPLERDLMFIPDAAASHDGAPFYSGYGPVTLDPLALAYYRYEWVVQEIGDYGQRVFAMPELGQDTRQDAVRGFYQLFQPGDVVDAAEQHLYS
jgi:spectinomycin phosphotransferase